MNETSQERSHGAAAVEDMARDFWASRPKRPRRGRKIAGVAAAIGNRYGLDPVLVRVAFVVATFFGGAGVVGYLLGWLFLPEEGDEVSAAEAMLGRGRSSASTGFTIVLGIGVVISMGWLFNDWLPGWLSVVLVVGAVFLLHRNRAHLGRVDPPPPPSTPAYPGPAEQFTEPYPTDAGTAADQGAAQQPPAWDPLGAAPFAWDLPEPGSPEPAPVPPRRPRSKAGPIAFSLALIMAGAGALAVWLLGGWFTVPHVIGLVLGVLGIGMVAGSFARGGRGLIGLAVPLSVIGVLMTVVSFDGVHGVGEIDAKPARLADVQSEYRKSVGSITVDLTALPDSGSVRTSARLDVGEVVVIVPKNADVRVDCEAGLGDVSCLGQADSGGGSPRATVSDDGADGEGGLFIDLDAIVSGPGSVEVRRG